MRTAIVLTAFMIVALAVGVLTAPWPASAQPAGKVYRVGFLSSGPRPTRGHPFEAFQRRLQELGYAEGRNLVIEGRWAEGDVAKVPGLAAELVRAGVDVIVTVVSGPTRAAMNATTTIPIVMIGVGSPVERGFVASLARPGGNVTGLSADAGAGIYGKRLELLREALPRLLRMGYLGDPIGEDPVGWKVMQGAAQGMKLVLERVEAGNASELESALAAIVRLRPDAVYVPGSPFHFAHLTRIHEVTLKNRIPVMHLTRLFVEAGGLMSYGPDIRDLQARAAVYVDKILKGAWPGDLPVERPTKFELIINLKTARALGLTIPQSLLQRADEVIR